MLYKFVPSPTKDPENEPVNDPLSVSKVSNLESSEPDTLVYDEVKELKSFLILPVEFSSKPNLLSVLEV